MTSNRPLLTLALFCCNHQRYVGEAIAGALSQTYSPLEIFICDDSSDDESYRTICQAVAGYSGPHVVRALRTPSRLGFAKSLNLVLPQTSGELISIAACDDVSLPERVESTYNAWCSAGRRHYSLHTRMFTIDEDSRRKSLTTEDYSIEPGPASVPQLLDLVQNFRCVAGASQTIHRDVFSRFGPLDSDVLHEDIIFPFRAALLGGVAFLPTPVGMYRQHVGGISQRRRTRLDMAIFWSKSRAPVCRQMIRDLDALGVSLPSVRDAIHRMERRVHYMHAFHTQPLRKKPMLARSALAQGVAPHYIAKQLIKSTVLNLVASRPSES